MSGKQWRLKAYLCGIVAIEKEPHNLPCSIPTKFSKGLGKQYFVGLWLSDNLNISNRSRPMVSLDKHLPNLWLLNICSWVILIYNSGNQKCFYGQIHLRNFG